MEILTHKKCTLHIAIIKFYHNRLTRFGGLFYCFQFGMQCTFDQFRFQRTFLLEQNKVTAN